MIAWIEDKIQITGAEDWNRLCGHTHLEEVEHNSPALKSGSSQSSLRGYKGQYRMEKRNWRVGGPGTCSRSVSAVTQEADRTCWKGCFTPVVSLPQTHKPSLTIRKTEWTPQLRDFLQNTLTLSLTRLSRSSKQRESEKTVIAGDDVEIKCAGMCCPGWHHGQKKTWGEN